MIKQIIAWLDSLSTLVKIISLAALFGSAIIAFVGRHDKKIIERYDKKNSENAQAITVQRISRQMDSLMIAFKYFNSRQDSMIGNQKLQYISLKHISDSVNIVSKYVGYLILNTADKNFMRDWLNAFEKKNDNSLYLIAPKQNR